MAEGGHADYLLLIEIEGFRRVELAPGEERNIAIEIQKDELRFWTSGGWVLDKEYSNYVGNESKKVQEV